MEKDLGIIPVTTNVRPRNARFYKLPSWKRVFVIVVTSISTLVLLNRFVSVQLRLKSWDEPQPTVTKLDYTCKPPLPFQLIQHSPPTAEDPAFEAASWQFTNLVSQRASMGDIDSVVVGIVGSDGLIWSTSAGRLKANGSEYDLPDIHSVYRIASISKLFAAMETYILRDKGILSWDDPVQKHLSNFTYNHQSWKERLEGKKETSLGHDDEPGPITLRMLATHLSGLGRDLPPYNFDWWPIPPPDSPQPQLKVPTLQEELDSISKTPLIAPPNTFPVYSNTGFSVLGASIAAAASKDGGELLDYSELLERDIFVPLGMNGSSFTVSEENLPHLAIPRHGLEVDLEFPDSTKAAGGQFSSVSDLAKTVQSFLTAHRNLSLISSATKREWIRPVHLFPDSLTETGLVWEIGKATDSHSRIQRYYSKAGGLLLFKSQLAFNPDLQFGVVVLATGLPGDATYFTNTAIELFQPVFEARLEEESKKRYAGVWRGEGESNDKIGVKVAYGSLWITEWFINGIDFMQIYFKGLQNKVMLWPTGRLDEFRISVGIPGYNSDPLSGCNPYWLTMDGIYSHKAPTDLLYFDISDSRRILKFPSANATLYQ